MNIHPEATTTSPSAAVKQTSGHVRLMTNIALWTGQILVGAFLFFSAVMKLTGAEQMVALFDSIGIGQWFRYVTAVLQIVGVALLVTPRLATVGALLLASTMGGAVITHLFVIGGSAIVPFVLFAVLGGIAWARRSHLGIRADQ